MPHKPHILKTLSYVKITDVKPINAQQELWNAYTGH